MAHVMAQNTPVLPGHTLVKTLGGKAFHKIGKAEICRFFLTCQRTSMELEQQLPTTTALTLHLFDVQEVAIHIIPRRPNDLVENDEIYKLIEASGSATLNPNSPAE